MTERDERKEIMTLGEMLGETLKLAIDYENAKERARAASLHAGSLLSQLNGVQEKVDKTYAAVKTYAHPDSNWGRENAEQKVNRRRA